MDSASTPHLGQRDDRGHYAPGVRLRIRTAGAQHKLRVFVNNDNNVRQEMMPVLGIQLMRIPFVQIFQKVGRSRLFQKAIPVIHLLAQRTQQVDLYHY